MLTLAPTPDVHADGLAFKGRASHAWQSLTEDEQAAVIHFRDGVETLVLAINVRLENEDDRGLWIVPVPGPAGEVTLELVDTFPDFRGYDPRARAVELLYRVFQFARLTQIYTILADPDCGSLGSRRGPRADVLMEVNKWGLRTELLEVDSLSTLRDHLRAKDVELEETQLRTLREYVPKEHLFAVTWLASRRELLAEFPALMRERRDMTERMPSLVARFPCQRPFFPLKPTSAYGQEIVPLRLMLIGHYCPQSVPDLDDELKMSYLRCEIPPSEPYAGRWGSSISRNAPLTLLRCETQASDFTGDLYFDSYQAPGLAYADGIAWFHDLPKLVAAALGVTLALSWFAGGVTGWWVCRSWRCGARLGMVNLATLLAVGLVLVNKERTRRFLPKLSEDDAVQFRDHFFLRFTVVFVLLTLGAHGLLLLPL